ncbi:hypothetical protein MWU59_00195 [Flavobacteriaceae bacterium F08102]|nr:hypothetical protein [Flavobacteriaceae bacterium F08102]
MEKENLKIDLVNRIHQIDDLTKLTAIQTILDTLEEDNFSILEKHDALEPEDFAGYIKEWIKNM